MTEYIKGVIKNARRRRGIRLLKPFQGSAINLLHEMLLQYLWFILCGYDRENIKLTGGKMGKPLLTSPEEKLQEKIGNLLFSESRQN